MYLGSRFESAELWRSDVGSVMQQFVFSTFSNKQEVEATLITAEHVLPLHTHMHTHTDSKVRYEEQLFILQNTL